MSEEKKPTPSTNIPLLSYRKSEQKRKTQKNFMLKKKIGESKISR